MLNQAWALSSPTCVKERKLTLRIALATYWTPQLTHAGWESRRDQSVTLELSTPPGAACQEWTKVRLMRAVFAPPVLVLNPDPALEWSMDSTEKPPVDPPWPSVSDRKRMCEESSSRHPETPLGPIAQAWVDDLQDWYRHLQNHFGFDPSDLYAGTLGNGVRDCCLWRSHTRASMTLSYQT